MIFLKYDNSKVLDIRNHLKFDEYETHWSTCRNSQTKTLYFPNADNSS